MRLFRNRAITNVLLIGMIALIMFYVSNSDFSGGAGNSEMTQAGPLTSVDSERIQVIELQRVGQPRLKLNKLEGNWWLTEPVMVHADITPVQRLLEILELESHSHYDVGEVNLESAGLWPARTILRFDEVQLSMGGTDPLHGYRYILFNEKVHLVDDHFYHIVIAEYPRFVNRLAVPQTVALEMIETPLVTLSLKNDVWKSQPELGDKKIREIVSSWRQTFSRQVIPYQKREGAVPVILTASNPKVSVQLDVYYDDATLVMGRRDIGIEYHLPRRMVKELAIAE